MKITLKANAETANKIQLLNQEIEHIELEIEKMVWEILDWELSKKEIKLKLLPLMEKKRGIILIEFYYDAFIIFDEKIFLC